MHLGTLLQCNPVLTIACIIAHRCQGIVWARRRSRVPWERTTLLPRRQSWAIHTTSRARVRGRSYTHAHTHTTHTRTHTHTHESFPPFPCTHCDRAGVFAYVILKTGHSETEELLKDLRASVRKDLGGFAAPDFIMVRGGQEWSALISFRVLPVACSVYVTLLVFRRSRRVYPRRDQAKSCAAFCAKWRQGRYCMHGAALAVVLFMLGVSHVMSKTSSPPIISALIAVSRSRRREHAIRAASRG